MNVQALKRKILDCGYNIVEFSDKVSIDRSTFYRRLEKDGNSFTIEEALRIKDVLSLTDAEAYSIFLSEKSQKWEKRWNHMKEIKEKLHQVILKRLDMAMNETSYTDPYIVPYIELYERLEEKSVPQKAEHSKK